MVTDKAESTNIAKVDKMGDYKSSLSKPCTALQIGRRSLAKTTKSGDHQSHRSSRNAKSESRDTLMP